VRAKEVTGEEGVGEAKREEGGRMGPWSSSGVRIGYGEKWKWTLRDSIKGAHERTIYSVDWAKGGVPESKGGLGRLITGGGDGVINVFQMVSLFHREGRSGTHEVFKWIADTCGRYRNDATS
jgi:hypothetical protein